MSLLLLPALIRVKLPTLPLIMRFYDTCTLFPLFRKVSNQFHIVPFNYTLFPDQININITFTQEMKCTLCIIWIKITSEIIVCGETEPSCNVN